MTQYISPYLFIAATVGIFFLFRVIQRRSGLMLLNPILLTIILLICLLKVGGIDYATYRTGGDFIDFWLKPAVVALGVPLYKQLSLIRRQMLPLILSQLAGCVAGIVSVVLLARFFGATPDVVLSLAPKAVTTPIAIEISNAIGGIPPLTAAVVVCTGIFGGMAGFQMARITGVNSHIAGSLSVGTAAHAIGTAAALERGERFGAYSSLGLTMNGLLTSLLAPYILAFL